MSKSVKIIVLYGGVGAEREISLKSGEAIASALGVNFDVGLLRLDAAELPKRIKGLDSNILVFPALHGTFGEDGTLQAEMEASGIEYCGCDARASRLCMAKDRTKEVAREQGISVPSGMTFNGTQVPLADDLIARFGVSVVIKPIDKGSSVGLCFAEHRSDLGIILSRIHEGQWLIEERIRGRELTVGVLHGVAMGIVEVVSSDGIYDYKAKYTSGVAEYIHPAKLEDAVEVEIKAQAEQIFQACHCRDFARVDFLLDGKQPYFLEVNTLPGLTATSLLPKSASCVGYDFERLAVELVVGGLQRLANRKEKIAG